MTEKAYTNWTAWPSFADKRPIRLTNSNIGIIGLGRIGTAVAMRARAFGMKILFYDPYIADGIDKALNFERLELNELLERADVISIHTPLTSETRNMVNMDFFDKVKPGAILINTARGSIVSFEALYGALRDETIMAFGTDVLPIEPPDSTDPLTLAWLNKEEWIRNKIIVTPHNAFYSKSAELEMRTKAALEIGRVIRGEAPRNCVNKEYLKS